MHLKQTDPCRENSILLLLAREQEHRARDSILPMPLATQRSILLARHACTNAPERLPFQSRRRRRRRRARKHASPCSERDPLLARHPTPSILTYARDARSTYAFIMRPTEPGRLVGLVRALRRRSVALAAVNLATAAVGVAAEVAGVWMRCETKKRCAVVAVAALTLVRIVVMVGMARAQEMTALAVASDAERGGGGSVGGPSQDFAKRETRVGGDCFSLATFRMRTYVRTSYNSRPVDSYIYIVYTENN